MKNAKVLEWHTHYKAIQRKKPETRMNFKINGGKPCWPVALPQKSFCKTSPEVTMGKASKLLYSKCNIRPQFRPGPGEISQYWSRENRGQKFTRENALLMLKREIIHPAAKLNPSPQPSIACKDMRVYREKHHNFFLDKNLENLKAHREFVRPSIPFPKGLWTWDFPP